MKQALLKILSLALCLALCAGSMLGVTGCSSKGVSPDKPDNPTAPESQPQSQPMIIPPDESIPLDIDPLTGAARDASAGAPTRPVAVMIDNAHAALPQSGIAAASVVYEMVTEGGIPRMMAVFAQTNQLHRVGPVRSTRDQFVQVLIPQNMMLLHIGSSIYAADMLRTLNYPTVDGIYLGTMSFAFDEARAAVMDNSHCFYTDSLLADAGLEHQGISYEGTVYPLFHFAAPDAERIVPATPANTVDFAFSSIAPVSFVYDSNAGKYFKSEYGDPQMDEFTGEQLSYTNLVLLGCNVTLKTDGLCTDYELSQGAGYYITAGGCQPITWKKGAVEDRLLLYDATGAQLTVNVGTSYVGIVDNRALQKTLTVDGQLMLSGSVPQTSEPAGSGE